MVTLKATYARAGHHSEHGKRSATFNNRPTPPSRSLCWRLESFGAPASHEADITARFHSGQKSLKAHQKVTATHWKIHHGANAQTKLGAAGLIWALRHEMAAHIDGALRERTRVEVIPTDERPTLTMAEAIFAASHGSLTMPTQRTPYGTRQGKVTLALQDVHRSREAF
jgi:hypothetical protein